MLLVLWRIVYRICYATYILYKQLHKCILLYKLICNELLCFAHGYIIVCYVPTLRFSDADYP